MTRPGLVAWTAAAILSLALLSLPLVAYAATAQVSIIDFAFQPQSVTVNVGDTVRWTNMGPSQHTTTSDTGVWDSRTLNVGGAFSFVFRSAGTFAYHCAIHEFMRGTVIVQAPPPPPPTPPPPTPPPATPPPATPPPETPPPATPPPATPQPTVAPTTPAPTPSPTATPSPTRTETVARTTLVALASPSATAVPSEAGPGPLIVAGAVVVVAGLAGLAFLLARRR